MSKKKINIYAKVRPTLFIIKCKEILRYLDLLTNAIDSITEKSENLEKDTEYWISANNKFKGVVEDYYDHVFRYIKLYYEKNKK